MRKVKVLRRTFLKPWFGSGKQLIRENLWPNIKWDASMRKEKDSNRTAPSPPDGTGRPPTMTIRPRNLTWRSHTTKDKVFPEVWMRPRNGAAKPVMPLGHPPVTFWAECT